MLRSRALLVFGLIVAPSFAFAQSDEDKSTARALGQQGQDALDKKDWKTAADLFHRAVAIFDDAKAPVPPTLLLGLARSDAGIGHFIASQEAYSRLIHQGTPPGAPAIFAQAVEDGKREIDGVSARVASVTINVTGCDKPTVTLDDKPISAASLGVKRPVDPGQHLVKASAAGCKAAETAFTVTDAASSVATVTLTKDPNAEPAAVSAQPTTTTTTTTTAGPAAADQGAQKGSFPAVPLAIAGFGVGVAGVALGAITGIVAMGKHGTLQDECKNPDGSCPASAQGDLDSFHTMGTLSTVGFVVGGVGLAAGLVLLLTAPKSAPTKTSHAWVLPTFGPGVVGAVGHF